jgi:hypothetical protein
VLDPPRRSAERPFDAQADLGEARGPRRIVLDELDHDGLAAADQHVCEPGGILPHRAGSMTYAAARRARAFRPPRSWEAGDRMPRAASSALRPAEETA